MDMEFLYIIVPIVAIANMLLEFKRTLMMLQQNSYRNDRYMSWLRTSEDTTSYSRLIGLAVLVISVSSIISSYVSSVLIFLFSLVKGYKLLCAKYKKPLVFTKRAWRIYTVALILAVAVALVAIFVFGLCSDGVVGISYTVGVLALLLYVVSHIIILCANWLLTPVEKHINKKYYDDAAKILASMPDLKVIGITGSYGKTSTKHYLNRLLSEKYDVLMTPGSYNTTLGVIRTIREQLRPYNEVFIVEMGAKQRGDIKEICDLVHPTMGIVTAVGEQHLESFKSIDNVQRTKFELIDALPSDGLGVVNDDFPNVANRKVENVDCLRYAVNAIEHADYTAQGIRYDDTGTWFTIKGENIELDLHTYLVGECNISNLMAAVIIALKLDVPEEKIRYAVEKIEQVEHRLNLKRTPSGITIIDDAYNSNPMGSAMALDVLAKMNKGKRIVITPGMIELGERQYELNETFGKKIAESADIAIIVGEYNRDALLGGLSQGKMDEKNIYAVPGFDEAQRQLASLVKAGDTVLYENDLPDTFK